MGEGAPVTDAPPARAGTTRDHAMARPEFDIVVIGGGSGGLVVAAGGSTLGAKVALVERHKLGGDCLWYGCVPSKALIKSARVAHEMRNAPHWALPPRDPPPDLARVMERVRAVIARDRAQRQPRALSRPRRRRDLRRGPLRRARRVRGRTGGGSPRRTFVIATGSRPAVPPIAGPRHRCPTSPTRRCSTCASRCRRWSSIGGGPIGMRAGAGVPAARQRGRGRGHGVAAPAAGGSRPRRRSCTTQLVHEGVALPLRRDDRARRGTPGRHRADAARQGRRRAPRWTRRTCWSRPAAGSTPTVSASTLPACAWTQDRIVVDDTPAHEPAAHLRDRRRRGRLPVHAPRRAPRRASCCAMRSSGCSGRSRRPFSRGARTPIPSSRALVCRRRRRRQRSVAHRVYRFPFEEIDRAHADGETEGFAKLLTDPKGRLLGAAIVGPHAGELIAEYALAIAKGMSAERHLGVDPHVPDARLDQPPRGRPADEGRPDAEREALDQARLPPAGRVVDAPAPRPRQAAATDASRSSCSSSAWSSRSSRSAAIAT